jgi:hypothetical protein
MKKRVKEEENKLKKMVSEKNRFIVYLNVDGWFKHKKECFRDWGLAMWSIELGFN